MQIIRVIKNNNFTTICNKMLRDKNLSMKAKGLLGMLLGLPPDWNLTIAGLSTISKEGTRSISTIMTELINNGYVVRNAKRKNNRYDGYSYVVYETSNLQERCFEDTANEDTQSEDTQSEDTQSEDIQSGIQLNKDILNKDLTNNLINKRKIKGRSFQKPLFEDVKFYVKERGNIIDAELFFNHYESNGWLIGKNKMKDWKAAVRSWEAREIKSGAKVSKVAERLKSHQDAKEMLKKIHNGNKGA